MKIKFHKFHIHYLESMIQNLIHTWKTAGLWSLTCCGALSNNKLPWQQWKYAKPFQTGMVDAFLYFKTASLNLLKPHKIIALAVAAFGRNTHNAIPLMQHTSIMKQPKKGFQEKYVGCKLVQHWNELWLSCAAFLTGCNKNYTSLMLPVNVSSIQQPCQSADTEPVWVFRISGILQDLVLDPFLVQ